MKNLQKVPSSGVLLKTTNRWACYERTPFATLRPLDPNETLLRRTCGTSVSPVRSYAPRGVGGVGGCPRRNTFHPTLSSGPPDVRDSIPEGEGKGVRKFYCPQGSQPQEGRRKWGGPNDSSEGPVRPSESVDARRPSYNHPLHRFLKCTFQAYI